ncbi:bacillithiol system redox-active protein YtxJ [Oceanobacillus halotolerans]|uniref:bacillithiol system redox-active protein YtxJ n=1 Tax=Oceanobacillus halotolerans TaxID=2663380 RepID=UPI0013DD50DF|nr:bacillithiol system redox-active protein YtxJ [Oceanobacillus halotolerans]
MATLQELHNNSDWDYLLEISAEKPVLLFKHSTTCPISAGAFDQYQSFLANGEHVPQSYMVKVIESRTVSNQVERDTGVKHESPQIFLIRDKEVVWHTSHGNITAESIKEALNQK